MEYREIGRTGLSAGIIGLGSEHLDNKPYATVVRPSMRRSTTAST